MGQDDRIRRCKSTTTLEIFILFLPALEYKHTSTEFYKITILVKYFFFVPYLLYPESKVITYIKFRIVMFMQHTNVWNYQRVSGLSEGKNKIIKLGFAKFNVLVMEKKEENSFRKFGRFAPLYLKQSFLKRRFFPCLSKLQGHPFAQWT